MKRFQQNVFFLPDEIAKTVRNKIGVNPKLAPVSMSEIMPRIISATTLK
tara:strand:- start:204 stop:350 length:147 start_codon:yes stop_codon:yes gene_type:complete